MRRKRRRMMRMRRRKRRRRRRKKKRRKRRKLEGGSSNIQGTWSCETKLDKNYGGFIKRLLTKEEVKYK